MPATIQAVSAAATGHRKRASSGDPRAHGLSLPRGRLARVDPQKYKRGVSGGGSPSGRSEQPSSQASSPHRATPGSEQATSPDPEPPQPQEPAVLPPARRAPGPGPRAAAAAARERRGRGGRGGGGGPDDPLVAAPRHPALL
ncbi:hypothetical protein DL765_006381 [Monosporascus sp. GIB2]|nr:hypothetical protein DL765_006381 [Monosporascus sp. GIB2]